MEVNKKLYENYVKEITPVHSKGKNMLWAFLTGGGICALAQLAINSLISMELERDTAMAWTQILLIGASILLTGLNIYPKLVKAAGAGALVPITGFANSMVAPALEYQVEGQVFGVGCKIFTIAGPVLLYGIVSTWGLGILYYILSLWNFGW